MQKPILYDIMYTIYMELKKSGVFTVKKFSRKLFFVTLIITLTALFTISLSAEPIEITTAEQLADINNGGLDGDYVLINDIDLSGYANWKPIGDYSTPFTGNFNGGGYKITGLTINSTANNAYFGLFGVVGSGGVISNVGVDGTVSGTGNYSVVGGLIGRNEGKVENSYATVDVSGAGSNSAVGGLIGWNNGGAVNNSYATGEVSGVGSASAVGGLIGLNAGEVTNSYATGEVSGTSSNVGGLIGMNSGATVVTDCYFDTETTKQTAGIGNGSGGVTSKTTTEMKKRATFDGWNFDIIWYIDEDNDYPKFIYSILDNNQGDGSETNPYKIYNEAQLNAVRYKLGAYYTVMNDIALTSANWTPIGDFANQFTGNFDGGGHVITGLTINSAADYVGLFGYVGSGGVISNVSVDGKVSATGSNSAVGGLIGASEGKVTNSYAAGEVSVTGEYSRVGGLIGASDGEVTNSYATGVVSGAGSNSAVGGLIGENYSEVTNSYATGEVSGTGSNSSVGGLIGGNDGEVTNSYAKSGIALIGQDDGNTTTGGGDLTLITGVLDSTWDKDIWGVTKNNYPYLKAPLPECKITFTGTSITTAPIIVNYGVTAIAPETPTLDGRTFQGWYDGSTPYNFTKIMTGDLILTGIWDDEDIPEPKDNELLKKLLPIAVGIVSEIIENEINNANTVITPKPTDVMFENFPYQLLINENNSKHKVTFDSNGGTEVAPQTVEHNGKITEPEPPTREGYTFGGWYIDLGKRVKADFNKSITSDVTLIAMWIEN